MLLRVRLNEAMPRLICLVSHEEWRLAVTVALLLRGDRAGQVGEDLAGAHDQVGDLGLDQGRVFGFDDGDAAHRGLGAGLGRGLGDLGRLGRLGGGCLHAGGRRVEGGLGGVGFLGFGGLLRVRVLCPGLVGGAERVPCGGRGGAGGGDDLVEGGGQRRGDRAEEGLGVLGVGLQGGGDDRGGRARRVEGDAAVRQDDRAGGGGRDLVGRGPSSSRAAAGRVTGSSTRKTSAPDTIARAMRALKRSHSESSEGRRSTR